MADVVCLSGCAQYRLARGFFSSGYGPSGCVHSIGRVAAASVLGVVPLSGHVHSTGRLAAC